MAGLSRAGALSGNTHGYDPGYVASTRWTLAGLTANSLAVLRMLIPLRMAPEPPQIWLFRPAAPLTTACANRTLPTLLKRRGVK